MLRMSGLTLINLFLIALVGGAFFFLTRAFLQKTKDEKRSLEAHARALALDQKVESWHRGFHIPSAGLAFSADVFKEGDLRAGIVDVWRIRMEIESSFSGKIWFTNKRKDQRATADIEGQSLAKTRLLSDKDAARIKADPQVQECLKQLLDKRRLRQLEFREGYLHAVIERDLATILELDAYYKDLLPLKEAFEALQLNDALPLNTSASSTLSGNPLGVPTS